MIALPLIFVAAYVVFGIAGFGSALIAMPLLSPLIGIGTAAPLYAIIAIVSEGMMLLRYREHLNFRAVWRLVLASTIAIPIGIVGAQVVNQNLALLILGVFVGGYGIYGLWSPHLPRITNSKWAYGFGFISGLLSGAYNTGGPSIVIYGSLSRWTPNDFKSSMQSLFILNSVVVVALHAVGGHMTAEVWADTLLGMPAMVVGMLLGWQLEKRVNPEQFRKLVLVLLVVIGANLIITNLHLG